MKYGLVLGTGVAAAILLVRNLYVMFLLPDESAQGAIYRILFFHAPGAMIFMIASFFAMLGSIAYLWRRDMRCDAFASAVTEVGVPFGAVNLITGMIWARIIWGIWWAWDARLTFMLISELLFLSYLMLRRAIDEPTTRARSSAVLSIFTFPAVVITWKSIEWWRTQHPAPVLSIRGAEGAMDPRMESTLYWNLLALLLLGCVMLYVRMRQERMQRELDALRRHSHAI